MLVPYLKVETKRHSGKLILLSRIALTHFLFRHEHAGRVSSTFFALRSQHGGWSLLVWRVPVYLLTMSEGLFTPRRDVVLVMIICQFTVQCLQSM
jgi:hypothetical protein